MQCSPDFTYGKIIVQREGEWGDKCRELGVVEQRRGRRGRGGRRGEGLNISELAHRSLCISPVIKCLQSVEVGSLSGMCSVHGQHA